MVNFYSTVLLGVVSGALATPVARTTADVLSAIADVSTATTSLDGLITAYANPGGTLSAALGIHNSAVALNTKLGTATTVANNNGAVVSPDADSILAAILSLEPTIEHALVTIVEKRPAFVALPVGGIPALVKSDLTNLRASTSAFADSLINNAPAAIVPEGQAYKTRVLAAFDVALAAY